MQLLEGEVSLHNPSGLDPSPQHVLLGGDVIQLSDPLQIIQVTEGRRKTTNRRSETHSKQI